MPTGYHQNISTIVSLVLEINPKSVLDIGPGFGKYGMLSREFLEIWNSQNYPKKDWTTRIDAVEVFSDYITPVHEYIYDKIYVGDVRDIMSGLKIKYDLIFLIDVLEHFTKEGGEQLIKKLKEKSKLILISVPKVVCEQSAVCNNLYESYKSEWSKKELINNGAREFLKSEESWICLVYDGPKRKKPSVINKILYRLAERYSIKIKRISPELHNILKNIIKKV